VDVGAPLFATFALRASISTFRSFVLHGASLAMIDRHYGHFARDEHEHAIKLLDMFTDAEPADVYVVDASWTSEGSSVVREDNGTYALAGRNRKPSDGLERRPLLTIATSRGG
jgi:hypothetical protein